MSEFLPCKVDACSWEVNWFVGSVDVELDVVVEETCVEETCVEEACVAVVEVEAIVEDGEHVAVFRHE